MRARRESRLFTQFKVLPPPGGNCASICTACGRSWRSSAHDLQTSLKTARRIWHLERGDEGSNPGKRLGAGPVRTARATRSRRLCSRASARTPTMSTIRAVLSRRRPLSYGSKGLRDLRASSFNDRSAKSYMTFFPFISSCIASKRGMLQRRGRGR